jgi:hypothetical protein
MEFTDANGDEWHDWCRELTFTDVGQALHTLKMNQTFPHKCTVTSDTDSASVLHKPGKTFSGSISRFKMHRR